MFSVLFLWLAFLVSAERPWCVASPEGEACPWRPW